MADVSRDEIEVVQDVITIDMDYKEASMLRRALYFNKTIGERVAERDGEDAGAEIKAFLGALGDQLKDEDVERWDGRDE